MLIGHNFTPVPEVVSRIALVPPEIGLQQEALILVNFISYFSPYRVIGVSSLVEQIFAIVYFWLTYQLSVIIKPTRSVYIIVVCA